jgi:hypothetical protein
MKMEFFHPFILPSDLDINNMNREKQKTAIMIKTTSRGKTKDEIVGFVCESDSDKLNIQHIPMVIPLCPTNMGFFCEIFNRLSHKKSLAEYIRLNPSFDAGQGGDSHFLILWIFLSFLPFNFLLSSPIVGLKSLLVVRASLRATFYGPRF